MIVAQLGIDSHRTDPLTHLALDVQGFASLQDSPAPLDADRRRLVQENVDRQVDAVQRLIFAFDGL